MRSALNGNPMVQALVLGGIGILFAILLFSTVLKKDDAAATESAATTDPATATAPAPTAPVDPAAPAPVDPAPLPAPSATADPGAADGLLPTKGLPEDVLVAYAKDKAIALLVVDPNGISDGLIKSYTKRLRSVDDVEVFIVKSKDIGNYSRITAGVAVSRVPALVVVRPRKLSDAAPTAAVSYGFRSPASVRQALDDALFDGKQVSAYP